LSFGRAQTKKQNEKEYERGGALKQNRETCKSGRLEDETTAKELLFFLREISLLGLTFVARETLNSPFDQIAGLTFQGIAELVENIGAVPFASTVIKRVKSRICNSSHFLQAVSRPTLTL
jgi:hypothetical protein